MMIAEAKKKIILKMSPKHERNSQVKNKRQNTAK